MHPRCLAGVATIQVNVMAAACLNMAVGGGWVGWMSKQRMRLEHRDHFSFSYQQSTWFPLTTTVIAH